MKKFGIITLSLAGAFCLLTNNSFADTANTQLTTATTKVATPAMKTTKQLQTSTQQQALTSKPATTASTVVAKTEVSTETAKPNVQLKLEQKDKQLYAHVVINQKENSKGQVQLQWQAPKHAGCTSSVYALSYENKTYHTHAYRTIARDDAKGNEHVCTGTWTAQVLDADKNVIASSTFDIADTAATKVAQTNTVSDNKMSKQQG